MNNTRSLLQVPAVLTPCFPFPKYLQRGCISAGWLWGRRGPGSQTHYLPFSSISIFSIQTLLSSPPKMGKLSLATQKCIAPEKQLSKQKIYARLSWFNRDHCSPAVFLSTSLPGTIFSLINSCTGWTIKTDHSAAPKMLAWDLSSWRLPLISQEGAQISLNNQASMIPKRLMKSVKEKEDKWGKKKTKQNPCQCTGEFFEVSALGDKSLSHTQLSLTLLTAEPLQQISLSVNPCPWSVLYPL